MQIYLELIYIDRPVLNIHMYFYVYINMYRHTVRLSKKGENEEHLKTKISFLIVAL